MTAVRDPVTGRFTSPSPAAPNPAADAQADQPVPATASTAAERQGAGPEAGPAAPTVTAGQAAARPASMASPLGTVIPAMVAESPRKPTPAPAAPTATTAEPAPPAGRDDPAPAARRPGRLARVAIGAGAALVLFGLVRLAGGMLRAWTGQRAAAQPQGNPQPAAPPAPGELDPETVAWLKAQGIDPSKGTL